MAAFWLFLNFHHFIIDGVIWKGRHPEIQDFLLKA
jgi:hypothetical protein